MTDLVHLGRVIKFGDIEHETIHKYVARSTFQLHSYCSPRHRWVSVFIVLDLFPVVVVYSQSQQSQSELIY